MRSAASSSVDFPERIWLFVSSQTFCSFIQQCYLKVKWCTIRRSKRFTSVEFRNPNTSRSRKFPDDLKDQRRNSHSRAMHEYLHRDRGQRTASHLGGAKSYDDRKRSSTKTPDLSGVRRSNYCRSPLQVETTHEIKNSFGFLMILIVGAVSRPRISFVH